MSTTLVQVMNFNREDIFSLETWIAQMIEEIDQFTKKHSNDPRLKSYGKFAKNLKQALICIDANVSHIRREYGTVDNGVAAKLIQFGKPEYKKALNAFLKEKGGNKVSGTKSFEPMYAKTQRKMDSSRREYEFELPLVNATVKSLKANIPFNCICGLIDNKVWEKIKRNAALDYLEENFKNPPKISIL